MNEFSNGLVFGVFVGVGAAILSLAGLVIILHYADKSRKKGICEEADDPADFWKKGKKLDEDDEY